MKVADSKREEFRKYLEKAGVMDALTKGEFLVDFQFILFLLLSFFPLWFNSSCEFVRRTRETSECVRVSFVTYVFVFCLLNKNCIFQHRL